jgi:hypothetical protein
VKIATPASPGELINKIPPVSAGGPQLINPIDGSVIEFDVVGNPRLNAIGERDIGALEVGVGTPPVLSVVGTGDGSVDLSWSYSVDPNLFVLFYYTTDPNNGTSIIVPGNFRSTSVSGLTNGTEYTFRVSPSTVGVPQIDSNEVKATPYGPLGIPSVTAVAGNMEVAVSWNLPDLGGRQFSYYYLVWREKGAPTIIDFAVILNPDITSRTIMGLKNGTEYEFGVQVATTTGEIGGQGLATATPHGDIGTVNRSPYQSLAANNKANKPKYWEREPYLFGDCTKHEVEDDSASMWEILTGDSPSALILKSDQTNDVWTTPAPGYYGTASAKDISHAIVCYDR